VPNSFSPGSTISSSQVNANFTDFAAEITGSLPTNGEKAMSGQMKAAAGTVAAPGITFGSDLDCGLYRIGTDNVGLSLGGAKVVDYATTGVAVTGTLSASGAITASAGVAATGAITATTTITATGAISGAHGSVPVGAMYDWPGTSAPTAHLLCYGQEVSRTTYAALDAVLGETYGSYTNGSGGVGTTHLKLPDCRGRVVAGQDDMGGTSANRLTGAADSLNGDTLGATGGVETHTNTQQGTFGSTASANSAAQGGGGVLASASHTHNTTISGETAAASSVQPTIILNKIIYTGVA
jgi:microcystin-dependent protein